MGKSWDEMVIRFGVLTVSDRSARGERADLSGPALLEEIRSQGWTVACQSVAADDRQEISKILSTWSDSGDVDVILTSGGTGFAPRDVTPEATKMVLDREAPGLAEVMRQESLKATPHGMLSRSVAGMRGKVLIINLPGSPRAAVENFHVIQAVLPHAVELLQDKSDAEKHH